MIIWLKTNTHNSIFFLKEQILKKDVFYCTLRDRDKKKKSCSTVLIAFNLRE
jgi:hypothetical protein